MATEFKPNIYPIIYWALAYGAIAGFLLFLMYLLARYVTIIWFPVFLVGLIWGGFRNYQKQKKMWATTAGVPLTPKTPVQEFREAVSDVTDAAREMVAQQHAEDAAAIQAEAEAIAEEQSSAEAAAPLPPAAPQTPPSQADRPTP